MITHASVSPFLHDIFFLHDTLFHSSLESLSEDDGNGEDNPRKQWSDWLNEEK